MAYFREAQARVAAWREQQCATACPTCPRNCCSGRLNPSIPRGNPAFAHLPRVGADEAFPDPPYLTVQTGWSGVRHHLVGGCPHLDGGRCSLYGHPDRPQDCHDYPLHLQKVLGGLGGVVLHAELSCPMIQSPRLQASLRELAQSVDADLLLHPDTTAS